MTYTFIAIVIAYRPEGLQFVRWIIGRVVCGADRGRG